MKSNLLKKSSMMFMLIIAFFSFTTAAPAQREVPNNLSFAPDLRVKSFTAEWIKDNDGKLVLKVTPVIEKNKDDKITTKPGEPLIIFVGALNQNVMTGATCEIAVINWTAAETEKSFGSCILSPKPEDTLKGGSIVVDSGNHIKELNENNNVLNLQIPPKR